MEYSQANRIYINVRKIYKKNTRFHPIIMRNNSPFSITPCVNSAWSNNDEGQSFFRARTAGMA